METGLYCIVLYCIVTVIIWSIRPSSGSIERISASAFRFAARTYFIFECQYLIPRAVHETSAVSKKTIPRMWEGMKVLEIQRTSEIAAGEQIEKEKEGLCIAVKVELSRWLMMQNDEMIRERGIW